MAELFSKSQVMGTFKGFNERGLEFAAEIIAPYDSSMLDRPQLGQFLLIELGNIEEASLGRITKFVPSGMLASNEGEDYVNTMQERGQAVPEDLKKQKLKYKVQIKLLGAVKIKDGKIIYVPSQRRLPHLGAKVVLPSDEVLKELCALSEGKTDLGDYVLGEFVYNDGVDSGDNIFIDLKPKLPVKFNVNNLVSKRSVVFARAGYGKSNLIKYLISELYRDGIPTTISGQKVGTLIFDADGEYFWPDRNNRPGLCDVDFLKDKVIVFTNRPGRSDYYRSWFAGEVKLDIRELPARDVIGIAVSPERQEQQNILKLKGVFDANWRQLVDTVYSKGYGTSDGEIGPLIGYTGQLIQNNSGEINAARSNMNNVVRLLHDPDSRLLEGTIEALRDGLIVIIDISLLSSTAGNNIAGLIMRKIFSYNQENFTDGNPPIPVITIIEEAQSVLGKRLEESSPFVEWVKEGRKYDLGAILITQQPGSMAPEILSQADNWFSFHLLSEGDASTLSKFNSHYSHDILAHLIGEPIPGNCYMWSAPKQPFVLPVRIKSFEALYSGNIKNDVQEPAFKVQAAERIKEKSLENLSLLADILKEKLKAEKNTLGLVDLENGFKGIKDGKLYFLIKEIKPAEELRDENQLKPLLMKLLFNNLKTQSKIEDGKSQTYYSAPGGEWDEILG